MSKILSEQLRSVKLGTLSKRHRKNTSWPLEKKIEVVTNYLVLGNMKLVAAACGVDYGLIRQWKIQPWWKDLENEIRATQNIALDNKLSKIVERSMEVTMDRLDNGEFILNNKTGELVRKPVAMKDAAKVATDFMTRQQVLRKEENDQPQISQQSVTEQLAALAVEFAKWQKKEKIKEEAIDIEPKEIVDAVSEEWKEGLQEGIGVGTQEETQSSEGPGGEEFSSEYDGEGRQSP